MKPNVLSQCVLYFLLTYNDICELVLLTINLYFLLADIEICELVHLTIQF